MISPILIESLLSQIENSSSEYQLEFYKAGGNNSVYRLISGGVSYALKKYKINPDDPRNRLGAECDFLSTINKNEPLAPVPKLYACERNEGIGLFSFVDGRKLAADEVQDCHIEQVVHFIQVLNESKMRDVAIHLGAASEARFSICGHMEILAKRIERLQKNSAHLSQNWINLVDEIYMTSQDIKFHDLDQKQELTRDEQILSPSDFGFHNALLDKSNFLTFIDFEYAGWDDPAKCVSDFFFQPEIPVNERHYNTFSLACTAHIPEEKKEFHQRRISLLRPVFGLRWCCIVLNILDPAWIEKNRNNYSPEHIDNIQLTRFNTAQQLLTRIKGML